MMKKEITKYIAIREAAGMNARTYRRYEEYETAGMAVAWFKGQDLGACRTVSIYEVVCDGDELPCAKKEIPEHGTLIFRKKNATVLYDKLAEEAKAEEEAVEPEHEEIVEPIALAFDNKEDVPAAKPSKWMVGTAKDGEGNTNYVVYRLLDADAPDEEGNRELRGIFDRVKAARAYATDRNFIDADNNVEVHGVYSEEQHAARMASYHNTPELVREMPAVEEEAPAAEPVKAGEPVRYYVVLKVAENRRQTRFHFKRRVFYDDQDAIDFASSRLRGGCKSAAVFMYDPSVIRKPPETFETTDAQHDAKTIKALLWAWEIYYTDRTAEVDSRDAIHYQLMKTQTGLKPYLSEKDNELVKHAQHFEEDGTAYKSLALVTMLCDADIRYTDTVRQNADIMTLAEAERWYKEATA